jgi:Mg2+ and Co2+ transporter CorA
MLLDPPCGDQEILDIAPQGSTAYQKGYRDFSSWPSQADLALYDPRITPPRDSLLDDIIYYWTVVASKAQVQEAISTPYHSSVFQRHIIAALWFNTLENLHAVLSKSETLLWELVEMVSPNLSDKKKAVFLKDFIVTLHETNQVRRRVTWYVIEMENNLYQLGIDSSSSPRPKAKTPKSDEKNFLAIYKRLLTYQSWSEKLVSILTSSLNLMEMEKSISDSESLSRLTYLGFLFIPLSFVATFFSMNGDFAVGQHLFWVFFVVALPFALAISVPVFWRVWLSKYYEHISSGVYNRDR